MSKSSLISQCLLLAASVVLWPSTSVFAYPAMSPHEGRFHHFQDFDWLKYTQQTLNDLKGKLNLKPEQTAAWDTWAAGVTADAKQQLEESTAARDDGSCTRKAPIDGTTPERMAKGIERLRAQTKWMEAHLERLDAAQVRTKTFYDALDTEQKTIFDLFWTVMHQRNAGYGNWQMPMHRHCSPMDNDKDETHPQ